MGILKFDCMATDPAATTFYGLVNADRYQFTGTGGWDKNMVLVKSNTNPSSVKTVNWSFLSSYSSQNLSIKYGVPTYAGCAVNSRGVVTFVAVHYVYNETKPYSDYITALRYDPAGVSDPPMSQGAGSWSTLSLNPAFGQVLIEKLSLWYTAVAGVETLNIAFVDNPFSAVDDTVHFGTFDEVTMTFNPAGKWAMPTMTHGVLKATLYRGDELYYFSLVGVSARLAVYSLKNVGTNTPALLRTYPTSSCSDIGLEHRLALLQNTLYMFCAREFFEPLSTLAIIKDVTDANSKFDAGVCLSTTIVNIDFFVPIGSSNTAAGGQPFALIQKDRYQMLYSMVLGGPTLATVEGGVDALIPEKFGYDPTETKARTTAPSPTKTPSSCCGCSKGGGGSGSGSRGGGSSGGGHTTGDDVAAVALALPWKMKLLIAVGAIIIGGGLITLFMKCCAGCYMVSKDIVNGEVPSGALAIDDLVVPAKKEEKVAGTGVGDRTYPVMTEHQTSTSSPYGTPLSPPAAQDNGLGYLFVDTTANSTQQSTILTIHEADVAAPLTPSGVDSPTSPTIPRYPRLDM
ncbi:hypothetical protein BGZ47_004925 [Haplosporangium gracile]|nr:hypothetical protein BGZ47_004925 [Haplosporangium gracile]